MSYFNRFHGQFQKGFGAGGHGAATNQPANSASAPSPGPVQSSANPPPAAPAVPPKTPKTTDLNEDTDAATTSALGRLAHLPAVDANSTYYNKPGEDEVDPSHVGFTQPGPFGRPRQFNAPKNAVPVKRSVPLATMVPQQPTLLRSQLAKQIANKNPNPEPPTVHQTPDGRHYVEDGHHKIGAAMMKGQKTITANVHDWVEDKNATAAKNAQDQKKLT